MMLELFPRKPITELLVDVNRKEAKKERIPGCSSSCRHAIFFSKRIVNTVFLSRLSQQTVVWKPLRPSNA